MMTQMPIARRAAVVLLLAPVLLLGACVRLPEAGPVVQSPERTMNAGTTDAFYLPNPPQPGEDPEQIVMGFLEAMRANPVQTNVARQFLSSAEQATWDPEQATITYGDLSPTAGTESVEVRVVEAHRLDERGVWTGPLPRAQTTLRFPMVTEQGEWRIADAPDALIVPDAWFRTQFRRVSLYFFDPTGRILVPEPVFVPRGEQLATMLTRGLLRGPGAELDGVSRTFFPADVGLELSVPVSANGTAEVSLSAGEVPTPEEVRLMLAQLSWTLRQEPSIRSIRLSVNGEPVSPPGGGTEFRVSGGQEYAPTVAGASSRLFGLLRGRLVEVLDGAPKRTDGPLGRAGARLGEVAVSLTAQAAAGVSRDGRVVRVAPLRPGATGRVTVRGRGFLKPSWDFGDRAWLVDRRGSGAEVSYVAAGRRFRLEVPGITGQQVTAAVISRDGSRLVAAVERAEGSAVVASRIQHDEAGEVVGATRAAQIAWENDPSLQISDLGWRTPSSLAVVNDISELLTEVLEVPVDGSHAEAGSGSLSDVVLRAGVDRYVGSPVTGQGPYVVTADGVVDLLDPDQPLLPFDPRVSRLTFVG